MKADWTLGLIEFLDVFGEHPNTSPEGSVRPGGGTVTDGGSKWAGPGNAEKSLGGGDGVVGHDEISCGSLEKDVKGQ